MSSSVSIGAHHDNGALILSPNLLFCFFNFNGSSHSITHFKKYLSRFRPFKMLGFLSIRNTSLGRLFSSRNQETKADIGQPLQPSSHQLELRDSENAFIYPPPVIPYRLFLPSSLITIKGGSIKRLLSEYYLRGRPDRHSLLDYDLPFFRFALLSRSTM